MTTEKRTNTPDYIEEAMTDIEGIAAVLRCMTEMRDEDHIPMAECVSDAVYFLARQLERVSEECLTPAWKKSVKEMLLAQERMGSKESKESA